MKHCLQDIEPGSGAFRVAAGVLPLAVAVVCGGVAFATEPAPTLPAAGIANPPVVLADRATAGARSAATAVAAERAPAVRQAASDTHDTTRPPGRPAPAESVTPSYLQPPTLHIGAIQTMAPWLPGAVRVEINTTAANAQAAVAGYCRSVGGAPVRCNHIADDLVAGAFIGGTVAAAPLGVPVGLLGGLVGGLVGGVLATVTALPYLLLPEFSISEIIAGAVAGANILGAALGGLVAAPFAVGGGLVGAAIGGLVGAAAG